MRPGPMKVIYAQDGSVDDYMGTIVLAELHKKGKIDFLGEILINGDSVLPYSLEIAYKFHTVLGIEDVPVCLSQGRMYNPFPYCYRQDAMNLAKMKEWEKVHCEVPKEVKDGEQFLIEKLREAEDHSVLYVCTASLTNLRDALKEEPELESKISQIYWMAGAVYVDGNLDKELYSGWNSKAEWNVFADPQAAAWVFKNCSMPILMFPLDIADKVPIQGQFMKELENQIHKDKKKLLDDIVYKAYLDICLAQPYYRLWDTVAVGYLARPDLYAPPETMELTVVTSAEDEGWTARKGQVESTHWREVSVFLDFVKDGGQEKFIHMVATHSF